MVSSSQHKPVIDDNPRLQSYYHSIESRISYQLLLGGTRHFGYYEHSTDSPLPISPALRRMEDKLASTLRLAPGARVLDAGWLLYTSLKPTATASSASTSWTATSSRRGATPPAQAYLPARSKCAKWTTTTWTAWTRAPSTYGVYTMETFVHAHPPQESPSALLPGPLSGGVLSRCSSTSTRFRPRSAETWLHSMRIINEYAAMPTNAVSQPGVFHSVLEQSGFAADVVVRDYSENIKPMTRLFTWLRISRTS